MHTTNRIETITDRLARMRKRPLAIAKIGDPEEMRTVVVHTCYRAGVPKPSRCGCYARISRASAVALIENGQAEWVFIQRNDGAKYVWRRAVVFTNRAKSGDNVELAIPAIVAVTFDQLAAETAHQLQSEKSQVERRLKNKKSAETKALAAFRERLTPDENAQWTDDNILNAILNIDSDPNYLAGVGAKSKRSALLDAAKKNGRSMGEVAESEIYRNLADAARISEGLLYVATRFANIFLCSENLSAQRGLILEDAPKGAGKLVSGGFDTAKITTIDAHTQQHADGTRKASAANFRPGSGGLEYAVEGGLRKSFDPIHNVGLSPDIDGAGDDHEQKQEEIFASAPAHDFGSREGSNGILKKLTLSVSQPERLPEREAILPDVFELAEENEAIAKKLGVSVSELSELEAVV